jgi:hypothetical protein
LNWSYVSYVDLNDASTLESVRTDVCAGYFTDLIDAQQDLDEENQYLVSTGFLNKLKSTIKAPLVTLASSKLVYTSLQTFSAMQLHTFASAASGAAINNSPVQPASNLTIEVYNDGTLQGYYIDEPIVLAGCEAGAPCLTMNFLNTIKSKVTISDVTSFCAAL